MNQNNTRRKRLYIGIIIFCLIFFIYDFYTNPCSLHNKLFLVNHSVIDKKYVYFLYNNEIKGVYSIWECNKLKYLNMYYNDPNYTNDSIINNLTTGIGFIQPCSYMEILKYNFKESIAYVKIYNSSPRMVKEDYVIVSMKCLHNKLPKGYSRYKE